MTIIDTITGISYVNCNKRQASHIIGVSEKTIYRWRIRLKKSSKKQIEEYNRYIIYFKEVLLHRGS